MTSQQAASKGSLAALARGITCAEQLFCHRKKASILRELHVIRLARALVEKRLGAELRSLGKISIPKEVHILDSSGKP